MSELVDVLAEGDLPGELEAWGPGRGPAGPAGGSRPGQPGLREDLAELAPVAAALAVLALLLGGILVGAAITRAAQTGQSSPGPVSTVLGIESEPQRIVHRCAGASGGATDPARSRVLAYMIDPGGWAAVLTGPSGYWFCSDDRDVRSGAELDVTVSRPYRAGPPAPPAYLSAPAYQRLSGPQRARQPTRGYTVGGLVAPVVTGVVVQLDDGRQLQTAVGGGSYVARAYVLGQVHAVAVIAYDDTGRVLQTVRLR